MDFPDLKSIESYVAQLSEGSRKVAVNFIFTELTVGLTRCRQVRESQTMTDEVKLWHTTQATHALRVAESTMWKLGLSHPEFDQMKALAERLKFELDDISESARD